MVDRKQNNKLKESKFFRIILTPEIQFIRYDCQY